MYVCFVFATLFACLAFLLKKRVWAPIQSLDNVSVNQSFFCWFTFNDIGNPQNNNLKWIYISNNIINVFMFLSCLMVLISFVILGLGNI